MSLGKTHITYTACHQVQQICQHFFEATGLTYFNFVRVYDDGSRICLSNNRPWMEFVFSNHDHFKLTFEERPEHGEDRYIIWDNIETIGHDSLMVAARDQFNIDHGFTIISSFDGYVEFQYYGTVRENRIINQFYINNLALMNSFGVYFRATAQQLIQQAELDKIIIEGHQFFWLEKKSDQYERKSYFNKQTIERFYLDGDLRDVYLTLQEAKCLALLLEGKSAKEIAKKIAPHRQLSPRTVEVHLEAARRKLRCNKKSDLIEIAKRSGFGKIAELVMREDRQAASTSTK